GAPSRIPHTSRESGGSRRHRPLNRKSRDDRSRRRVRFRKDDNWARDLATHSKSGPHPPGQGRVSWKKLARSKCRRDEEDSWEGNYGGPAGSPVSAESCVQSGNSNDRHFDAPQKS